jgi:hypothetical protein
MNLISFYGPNLPYLNKLDSSQCWNALIHIFDFLWSIASRGEDLKIFPKTHVRVIFLIVAHPNPQPHHFNQLDSALTLVSFSEFELSRLSVSRENILKDFSF